MAQVFAEPCGRGLIGAAPCPHELKRELPKTRRQTVLAACILASSMAFIDGSALTVALPNLRAHFAADLAQVQWVVNGYTLVLASLSLTGGALADREGKARMLALGAALFGLASVACALAPSPAFLIAARIVQGTAAAIVAPASLALIGATYPRAERNRAIGVWAAASALTTAGGPILGGWLTERFGWSAVFWINPPIALVAVIVLTWARVRDFPELRRFDVAGAAILAASLGALAWALSAVGGGEDRTGATAGSAPSTPLLAIIAAAGTVGLVLYALWERRSAHPMTPPRLVENKTFLGLNLATLLIYAGMSLMFFLLPFELIDRRALTPAEAGLAFLPLTLGVGLLSERFGALADRSGARALLIAGPLGAALGFLWLALGRHAPLLVGIIGPLTLLGLSFAILVAPLTASVMSSVSDSDEGLASGINNAASRIAQLIGVALAAGVAGFTAGFSIGLFAAAALSLAGAAVVAAMMPAKIRPDRDDSQRSAQVAELKKIAPQDEE